MLGWVLGEIDFPHGGDCLEQSIPVNFLHTGCNSIFIEFAFPIYRFLDFDEEGEIVLVTFCHIAHHEIVGKEPHLRIVDWPIIDNYYTIGNQYKSDRGDGLGFILLVVFNKFFLF